MTTFRIRIMRIQCSCPMILRATVRRSQTFLPLERSIAELHHRLRSRALSLTLLSTAVQMHLLSSPKQDSRPAFLSPHRLLSRSSSSITVTAAIMTMRDRLLRNTAAPPREEEDMLHRRQWLRSLRDLSPQAEKSRLLPVMRRRLREKRRKSADISLLLEG